MTRADVPRDLRDLADEAGLVDHRHADFDTARAALVDLDHLVDVVGRSTDDLGDLGVDPRQRREAVERLEFLAFDDRRLGRGLCADQPVDLFLQGDVLPLDVVVVDDAVPDPLDRVGHHARRRLDRPHHLREAVSRRVDDRIAAEIEREQQRGGQQQREDDSLAADGVDGHDRDERRGRVSPRRRATSARASRRCSRAHGRTRSRRCRAVRRRCGSACRSRGRVAGRARRAVRHHR